MRTYQQCLDWLYARQQFGIKLGLENMFRLAELLGSPQNSLRFLHVAGTNGKGSVCAMSEAILRAHGIRTGLFTSPHLVDFTERMQFCGSPIPRSAVIAGLRKIRALIEQHQINPTFFEIVCALALDWFRAVSTEIVVWETGMGGRLDATNIVLPDVCVITAIGMDHQRWLGDTIAKIACEKAGIIKPKIPVISVPQEPDALHVIARRAHELQSPLHVITEPYGAPVSLPGEHQRWNAAAAMQACRWLLPNPDESLTREAIAHFAWPGRFQRIGAKFILDGAHNPHAARALAATWRTVFPDTPATLVFGALADKDVHEALSALTPLSKRVVFVPVHSPRALTPHQLCELYPEGMCAESLQSALKLAQEFPEPALITGSLFLVGEALANLQRRRRPRQTSQ